MISVKVELTKEYQSQVSKIKKDMNLNKYTSMIPVVGVRRDSVHVKFTEDEIILEYIFKNGKTEKRCKYKDILNTYETDEGIIIYSMKRQLLFIPVFAEVEKNTELIDVLDFIDKKVFVTRTGIIRATGEADKKHGRKRYRSEKDSLKYLIGALLFLLFMLVIFVDIIYDAIINMPIEKDDAVRVSGGYVSYERHSKYYKSIIPRDIGIYLENTDELIMKGVCNLHKATQAFDKMEKGEMLYLLVNPRSGYVLEVRTESEELLNFKHAQKRITGLSILYLLWAVPLFIVDIYGIYLEIDTYCMCIGIKRKKEKTKPALK